jgi:hypothetical protein
VIRKTPNNNATEAPANYLKIKKKFILQKESIQTLDEETLPAVFGGGGVPPDGGVPPATG